MQALQRQTKKDARAIEKLKELSETDPIPMRQRKWIELFSDYDCDIHYYLEEATVVADVLSKKERVKPRTIIMDVAHAMRYYVHLGADKMYYDLREMYWWPGIKKDISIYVGKCLTCSKAESGESWFIGPELVQETTDKVILIKERLKATRDCQNSYISNKRKQLGFKVGDKVILKVSSWKEEIKVVKTLRFVEEPVEIIDREVRSLKTSKISLVKVRWNSKHGSEFTWEREDHTKSKYPYLFVDRAVEPAS
nr:hypothetical protein [Tanacetum cinerariifolium]